MISPDLEAEGRIRAKFGVTNRKFKLGDLFKIEKALSFNKNKLTPIVGKKYAYITRTSLNNGILKYTGFVNQKNINSAHTFSLGLLQMTFFYQREEWYAGQFVRKITPKFEINDRIAMYFCTVFNKQKNILSSVLVHEVDETFNNIEVSLPTNEDGTISFNYIESYIKSIEDTRLTQLDNYLIKRELADYKLTAEEIKLVNDFRTNQAICWGDFAISDLFDVLTPKKKFDANKVKILDNGYPYVVRTSINNGTRGYIQEDEQYLNEGNTISFGQDTATMFYRDTPFFTADKIKILKPLFNGFNPVLAQFIIAAMTKSFSTFTWGSSSYSVKVIKNQLIKLPINYDGQPDFEKMQKYIRAVEKGIIRGVVEWKDEQSDVNHTSSKVNNLSRIGRSTK
ncbi:MAG TPA: restriction endonuclease subunit S [Candidatus Enterococcus avicola]|uniref:Restriction endonuclease subunit S n=1 Tax=Candidatus Enterococcus avicola TaxID=2838561 RepID=A0A9D2F5L6_9ENTE|nr:restriction endonuclease subunit S [Candidatus Enterococcus avicola]